MLVLYLLRSKALTDPSKDDDSTTCPFWLNTTPVIPPRCSVKVTKQNPLLVFHNFTWKSEIIVCLLHLLLVYRVFLYNFFRESLLYTNALKTTFYNESKHYGTLSDCSLDSSLIWVPIYVIAIKQTKTPACTWRTEIVVCLLCLLYIYKALQTTFFYLEACNLTFTR